MQYRIAEAADFEAIAALHADSWRRTYRGQYSDEFLDGDLVGERREVWRARLGHPAANQFVQVAVASDRLVGFVCAYGGEDLEWGSLIDNLHVAHDHRGAGIGAVLLRQVGASLSESYASARVYLWVLEANRAARRFYEGLGAVNAEVVEMVNASGGTGRSCRYVWPGPAVLRDSAAGESRWKVRDG